MIPKVDDLTEPPVVGRHYLVPCVEAADNRAGLPLGHWPVIGPKHRDAGTVDFPDMHWHFDFRFLLAPQIKWAQRFNGEPFRSVLCVTHGAKFGLPGTENPGLSNLPILVSRRCNRVLPAMPAFKFLFRACRASPVPTSSPVRGTGCAGTLRLEEWCLREVQGVCRALASVREDGKG